MIRISNIHLPLDYTSETVLNKAAKLINVDKKFFKSCTIFRRSIDARKKDNIFFLATVDAELFVNEEKICKKFKNAEIAEKYEYNVEKFRGAVSPVVVGAGPAGLFAALILAQSGANPILIERGRDVDTRTEDVHNFWKTVFLTQQAMYNSAKAVPELFLTANLPQALKTPVSARYLLNL